MKNHWTILFILFLFFGCNEKKAPVSTNDVQEELSNTWKQFIDKWEAEDANGCASFYTEDGVNIGPESEIKKGREAIAEFYNFLFTNNLKSDYNHKIVALDAAGTDAIEQGQFTVDWVGNDSTTWTFNGRSLTHWKKVDDGNWQIKRFMFNLPPKN